MDDARCCICRDKETSEIHKIVLIAKKRKDFDDFENKSKTDGAFDFSVLYRILMTTEAFVHFQYVVLVEDAFRFIFYSFCAKSISDSCFTSIIPVLQGDITVCYKHRTADTVYHTPSKVLKMSNRSTFPFINHKFFN